MIKYRLECKSCKKSFVSWFASSEDFDKIKKLRLLKCKYCENQNIIKSLMAPSLNNVKKIINDENHKDNKKFKNQLFDLQKFIKKNFDYVGSNFVYEARSLHYSKKNKKKGVYGIAKKQDIKELKEEGIDTQTIPWINENEH